MIVFIFSVCDFSVLNLMFLGGVYWWVDEVRIVMCILVFVLVVWRRVGRRSLVKRVCFIWFVLNWILYLLLVVFGGIDMIFLLSRRILRWLDIWVKVLVELWIDVNEVRFIFINLIGVLGIFVLIFLIVFWVFVLEWVLSYIFFGLCFVNWRIDFFLSLLLFFVIRMILFFRDGILIFGLNLMFLFLVEFMVEIIRGCVR